MFPATARSLREVRARTGTPVTSAFANKGASCNLWPAAQPQVRRSPILSYVPLPVSSSLLPWLARFQEASFCTLNNIVNKPGSGTDQSACCERRCSLSDQSLARPSLVQHISHAFQRNLADGLAMGFTACSVCCCASRVALHLALIYPR